MLSKKTKIGLLAPVVWNVPPSAYGPWEKVVANLAQGLVAEGYRNVYLFATKKAKIPGVKLFSVLKEPLGHLSLPGKKASTWERVHISASLEFASKKAKVDIVHNHLNNEPLAFAPFLKIPMVTTTHGATTDPNTHPAFLYFRKLPYVSISDEERKYLPQLNYVATVYNPISFEEFSFYGGKRHKYLVFTGRMHPTKGVHNAIRLAKKLKIPLYLAGPRVQDAGNYFEEQIEPYIDNKLIFYLGNLSVDKIKKLVGEAAAFVGLIEWAEPFGLSVAESMALGTPVIATPRGSHREIVKDGVTGILVNSVGEAVRRFAEIESIDSRQCRIAAEKMFSTRISVQKYLKVYEKILSQKRLVL